MQPIHMVGYHKYYITYHEGIIIWVWFLIDTVWSDVCDVIQFKQYQ